MQFQNGLADNVRAVAIGRNFAPITSFSALPVQFDELGIPFYLNEMVRLDCAPCRRLCSACDQGGLMNLHNRDCYYTPNCPLLLVKVLINGTYFCQRTNRAERPLSADIVPKSLVAELQSDEKPLVLFVRTFFNSSISGNNNAASITQQDSGNNNNKVLYTWSLIRFDIDFHNLRQSIYYDDILREYPLLAQAQLAIAQGIDLNYVFLKTVSEMFFLGVNASNLDKAYLTIPKKNFIQYFKYQLKCVVQVGTFSVELKQSFTVVLDDDMLRGGESLEALDIPSETIAVYPSFGLARDTLFTFEVNSFSRLYAGLALKPLFNTGFFLVSLGFI